jgi:N-glycosylase/DNA lyase
MQVIGPMARNRSPMPGGTHSRALPAAARMPWWADVWERFGAEYMERTSPTTGSEEELRHELLFCLLGGFGVTFELAHSATDVISRLQPFSSEWRVPSLRAAIRRELEEPQFEPRRGDGSLRRYRFPRRKAVLVAGAASWVREHDALADGLSRRSTTRERREWLCSCPGVGLKTASWLLRNCGFEREVAILDIHVIRAMTEVGLIDEAVLPRDYERIEDLYLHWADELGACPAALDLFLWDVQRSSARSPFAREGRYLPALPASA